MSDGTRIRLIGIDTPERGECGHHEASAALSGLVLGEPVTLMAGARDDADRYGRLLRYLDLGNGTDANLAMIEQGFAIARYDSRDGYGRHDREDVYVAADAASIDVASCATPESTPDTAAATDRSTEPWNMPGPDLDCADIGMKVRITGPDYHRLDRDGDGWGCESYG